MQWSIQCLWTRLRSPPLRPIKRGLEIPKIKTFPEEAALKGKPLTDRTSQRGCSTSSPQDGKKPLPGVFSQLRNSFSACAYNKPMRCIHWLPEKRREWPFKFAHISSWMVLRCFLQLMPQPHWLRRDVKALRTHHALRFLCRQWLQVII